MYKIGKRVINIGLNNFKFPAKKKRYKVLASNTIQNYIINIPKPKKKLKYYRILKINLYIKIL